MTEVLVSYDINFLNLVSLKQTAYISVRVMVNHLILVLTWLGVLYQTWPLNWLSIAYENIAYIVNIAYILWMYIVSNTIIF